MFDGPIRDYAYWTPRSPAVLTSHLTVSYAEFDADIDRFGAAVAALGVVRGCGVVSLAIRSPYIQLLGLVALARLGVVSSPAADAADLCLTDAEGPSAPGLARLDAAWVTAMFAAEPRPLPRLESEPGELARVMLSSGTTARPRRVPFDGRRIDADKLANLRVYGAGAAGTWIPQTGVDSLLGFSMAVLGWSQGVAVANGLPLATLPALMETAATGLVGLTPSHLRALLGALPDGFQPRPGWRVSVAGASLPEGIAREAALRLTPDIRRQYGATESSQIAAGRAARGGAPGEVGVTPSGAIVQIIDDAGHPLPDDQSGEIRVRGERTAAGYLDDAQATVDRFRDGWFHTNDIGRRLPDGTIVVEGRRDDRMILGGGQKFMPAGLEDAAAACPGVLDCAAFAVPDAADLDVCWLAVVADEGFDRDNLAQHLAAYPDLVPNRFAWIDEIPRNAMGKIERVRLREALLAALAASASGG